MEICITYTAYGEEKMIARTIKKQILRSLKTKPVTLVTGARQVGKSTLCYEIRDGLGYEYVSLDDLRERKMAKEDPELFLSLHHAPLILDEVQYAPELFQVLEANVNKEKERKGRNEGMYLLTGSQTYELMKGISQSMAGRVSIVRMSPLSASEIFSQEEKTFEVSPEAAAKRAKDYHMDIRQLLGLIVRGLYPELYDKEKTGIESEKFYSDYVDTYLERDVSQIIQLRDKLKFQNFLEVLASLTGEELVYDTLAKAVGVKVDTIQSWLSVLVAGGIVYLLEPYHEYSIAKRIMKRPKIYFSDTGLACYLSRLNNVDVLQRSIFLGRFVETYIVNEIRKSYTNNGKEANMYYYRDSNQNEIDLVLLQDGELHLVECKAGMSYTNRDVKAFSQLKKSSYPIGTSAIICNTPSVYPIGEDVYALPITSI